MEKIGYIVCAFGFDYDDSHYSQSEHGDPVEVYDNEEDALKRSDELNLQAMKGKDLRYYNGGSSIADDMDAVEAWFERHGLSSDSLYIPEDTTIEKADLVQLYNMLYIQFHSVRSVKIMEPKPKPAPSGSNRFQKIETE